jgi:cholesterol transport system auxiliary component
MSPKWWPNLFEGGFAVRKKAVEIMLILLVATLCGCSAVPQSKYYELKVPSEPSAPVAGGSFPITLLVGPLKASHFYREDRLVYASEGEEMGTYQVQRWAAPPTEMMRELIWRSLRASHRYDAVYLLTSSSRGDFLLEGNLYDFKEVSGSKLVARVSLELELRDMKTGTIVWTRDYAQDEPVNGKDVAAVVAAMDQNAQRCVSDAEAGLTEYFTAHLKR